MLLKTKRYLAGNALFLTIQLASPGIVCQNAMAASDPADSVLAHARIYQTQFSSGGQGDSDCDAKKAQITSDGEQKVAATDPQDRCAVAGVITWKEEQELDWAQECAPNYVDQLQQALSQAQDQQTQACQQN